MWLANLSRRELIEYYLGSTKVIEGRVRVATRLSLETEGDTIELAWPDNPLKNFSLPSLMIIPEESQAILTAIAASPQTPSPLTGLTRILNRREARHLLSEGEFPINYRVLSSVVGVALIEAILHTEGRLGIRQVTPTICKRTMSYAWGRALVAQSSDTSLEELPGRWLETYAMLNTPAATETARKATGSTLSVLQILSQLARGDRPKGDAGELAFALCFEDRSFQEDAWFKLARPLERSISMDGLQALSREDRGAYLKEALRTLSSMTAARGSVQEDVAAACAFVATRLAPGSLEHLDILLQAGGARVLSWYALFAAVQTPREICSMSNGLGFRILRDLQLRESELASPTADISFTELKLLSRVGIDSVTSKIGHANELQVELIPFTTSTFTFQNRNKSRWSEDQLPSDDAIQASEILQILKTRLTRISAELSQLTREVPTINDPNPRKSRRR